MTPGPRGGAFDTSFVEEPQRDVADRVDTGHGHPSFDEVGYVGSRV